MRVAFCFIILAFTGGSIANIYTEAESNEDLIKCITRIINVHYKRREITYVDLHYDKDDIIKVIHSLPFTVVSRDSVRNLYVSNTEYVITASTSAVFSRYFPNLTREPLWNPLGLFLIIIKEIKAEDLKTVFDVLLEYHVLEAVVVNGTNDANSFTYNPFDNYNCGKKYDTIINLGKCLTTCPDNFYPPKLITGLRNCTFDVAIPQWPPFTTLSNNSLVGIEQYVLNIISELEEFNVHYTAEIDGQEFSTISANMSASGNLHMLQEKKTDIIFGGMMLTYFRADAFSFLCGHLPYMDDLRVLVHKAESVPSWKNLYLEFDSAVWAVLIATFTGYFLLIAAVLRVKDKIVLILMMWDLFFQHGCKRIQKCRGVFIFWVVFAYLISTYYQSSLVSITANPIKNYQISTDNDLKYYRIEPCISLVLQHYLNGVQGHEDTEIKYEEGCNEIVESMRTVGKSTKKYTIALNYLFHYNHHLFSNEQHESSIYAFKSPMYSIIYAYYLYKGFPLQGRLNVLTIQLRESGLIDRYVDKIFENSRKQFEKNSQENKSGKRSLLIPWHIFIVGIIVSTSVFVLEFCFRRESVSLA